MTRQIVLQSPAPVNRRQPLLGDKSPPAAAKEDKRGLGEVAGGTAAECAAIFCCCPCTVMNLLVLAVYKVPTGLCRKAWKKKKRQKVKKKKKKALLQQQQAQSSKPVSASISDERSDGDDAVSDESTSAAVDFETEMWDRFYGAGFWRSSSQREV